MRRKLHSLLSGRIIAASYGLGAAIAFAEEPAAEVDAEPVEPVIFGDAEALRVATNELLVRQAPASTAKRRGSLRRGTEVWASTRVVTSDCQGGFLLVGPSAWACDADGVFESRQDRRGSPKNEPPTVRFARIGERGALSYRTWDKVNQGLPDAELQPGYFVGITEEKSLGFDRYFRTTHGLYFLAEEATVLLPSAFTGRLIDDLPSVEGLAPFLPLGWVYVPNARASSKPSAPPTESKVPRLTEVSVLEYTRGKDKLLWFRTHLGWLSEKQLRVPSVSEPPESARNEGRYLDVDTETQTLVAFRDHKPWFITLVSTGQGNTPTPKGEYRIWAKLLYSDMDNLEEFVSEDERRSNETPYAVEAVPWVLFFSAGYGLHATYWHNSFGLKKSHGCVNLSLADAERLFDFVSPRLNTGWQAALPTDYDRGTIIRVR